VRALHCQSNINRMERRRLLRRIHTYITYIVAVVHMRNEGSLPPFLPPSLPPLHCFLVCLPAIFNYTPGPCTFALICLFGLPTMLMSSSSDSGDPPSVTKINDNDN
jgi:hypothetical protein